MMTEEERQPIVLCSGTYVFGKPKKKKKKKNHTAKSRGKKPTFKF
jgi:hypothetical protein